MVVRRVPAGRPGSPSGPRGPVPLSDMGSGENWLGYHIATLLSLH
ncbi:DUF3732 domain-containing protein, partial [Streptomyces sp. NPDC006798]